MPSSQQTNATLKIEVQGGTDAKNALKDLREELERMRSVMMGGGGGFPSHSTPPVGSNPPPMQPQYQTPPPPYGGGTSAPGGGGPLVPYLGPQPNYNGYRPTGGAPDPSAMYLALAMGFHTSGQSMSAMMASAPSVVLGGAPMVPGLPPPPPGSSTRNVGPGAGGGIAPYTPVGSGMAAPLGSQPASGGYGGGGVRIMVDTMHVEARTVFLSAQTLVSGGAVAGGAVPAGGGGGVYTPSPGGGVPGGGGGVPPGGGGGGGTPPPGGAGGGGAGGAGGGTARSPYGDFWDRRRRFDLLTGLAGGVASAAFGGVESYWAQGYQTDIGIQAARTRGEFIPTLVEEGMRDAARQRQIGGLVGGTLSGLGGLASTWGGYMLYGSLLTEGASAVPGLVTTGIGMALQATARGAEQYYQGQAELKDAAGRRKQALRYLHPLAALPSDFFDSYFQEGNEDAYPIQGVQQVAQTMFPVIGRKGVANLIRSIPLDTLLNDYPDALRGVGSLAALAGQPGGADVRSLLLQGRYANAAGLGAGYAASQGDLGTLGSYLGLVPNGTLDQLRQRAYEVIDTRAGLTAQQSYTQIAGSALAKMQVTGASYNRLVPQIGQVAQQEAAQIPLLQRLRDASLASGSDAGRLAALQIDAQIASIQAQVAGAPLQQAQVEIGQRSTGIQASQITAGLGVQETIYGGGSPSAILAAGLAQAGPLRQQAALERFAAGVTAFDPYTRRLHAAQASQLAFQARVTNTREAYDTAAQQRGGILEGELGLQQIGFERALYSGADAGALGAQLDRQIAEQRRMSSFYSGRSREPYRTPAERLAFDQAANRAAFEATFAIPRQKAETTLGIAMGQAGLSGARAGLALEHAELFGGAEEFQRASLGQLMPLQQQREGLEARLSAGRLSREEELKIQQQIVDLRRQELQITTTTTRQVADMAVQIAGSQRSISSSGLREAGLQGMGGSQALGYSQKDIKAARGQYSAAVNKLQVLKSQGVSPDSPQFKAAQAEVAQAHADMTASYYSQADNVVDVKTLERSDALGMMRSVASRTYISTGSQRALVQSDLDNLGGQIQSYQKRLNSLDPNTPEPVRRRLKQEMYGLVERAGSDYDELSQGFQDRLIGQVLNAPSSFTAVASQFTMRDASRYLSTVSPAYGFASKDARDAWMFRGPRLMASALGNYGNPQAAAASAEAAAQGNQSMTAVLSGPLKISGEIIVRDPASRTQTAAQSQLVINAAGNGAIQAAGPAASSRVRGQNH